MTLEQKMIAVLNEANGSNVGAWDMANKIWDNCMTKSQPGNGARIAHLRRVGENSKKIGSFVFFSTQERMYYLKKDEGSCE